MRRSQGSAHIHRRRPVRGLSERSMAEIPNCRPTRIFTKSRGDRGEPRPAFSPRRVRRGPTIEVSPRLSEFGEQFTQSGVAAGSGAVKIRGPPVIRQKWRGCATPRRRRRYGQISGAANFGSGGDRARQSGIDKGDRRNRGADLPQFGRVKSNGGGDNRGDRSPYVGPSGYRERDPLVARRVARIRP